MFKYVIFDLDGTLLNTLQDLANACNHTLRVLGLPPHPTESYKHFVGNGRVKLVQRMLPPNMRTAETVEKAGTIFDEYYATHNADKTSVYDGILQLLEALKQKGIKAAVVTNKPDIFAQPIITNYFGDLIEIVQGVSETVLPKPNPSGVINVISRLNTDAQSCLFVGDSNVDIQTANNVPDLKSCGVLWGFRTKDELLNEGASFIAATPTELLNIILQQ